MTWLALSFALGLATGWTAARYRVGKGKAQAPGTVSRDFSAPGMPYAGIIDADEIDAALRGDA